MAKKIPVVIATGNIVSGVTSWAMELRRAFAGHPRYEILLLNYKGEKSGGFDLHASGPEEAADLLHRASPLAFVPNYHWSLYMAGMDPRIRIVGICHADSAEEYYDPLAWYEPLISTFVAVSPECAAKLAGRIPARAGEIAVLPCAVVVPGTLQRDYRTSPVRLLHAGRIVQKQKRVMDFVPLAEGLCGRGVDYILDIAGEGPDLDRLKNGLAAMAAANRVRFLGRIDADAMPGLWRAHDICVQLSDFEGTSVSMLEAMAQGAVPVVTAASSGIRDVLAHGRNGFVVPVGDMDAVADAIARLAADRDALEAAGRAAHANAGRFSMDAYLPRFSAVLDRAFAARARPWPFDRNPRKELLIRELLARCSAGELARHVRLRTLRSAAAAGLRAKVSGRAR